MPKRKTKNNSLETLWINFRPNKLAEPRMHVHTEDGDHSFSKNKPVDWSKFTEEQKFEIEWVLDGAAYNEEAFGKNPIFQEYARLLIVPDFYKKLRELKLKADKQGIEFQPMRIMLEALKNAAENLEKQLKKK